MSASGVYLVVASNRAPHVATFKDSIKKSTIFFEYDYDITHMNDILVGVHRQLSGRKVDGIGLLLQSTQSGLLLCGPGELVVSDATTFADSAERTFFTHLIQYHAHAGRLDIFNACLSHHAATALHRNLNSLLKIPVEIWNDNIEEDSHPAKLYFKVEILANKLRSISHRGLDGYEKVRTVGKGAFGTAVLYKNTHSDSLVVIKEINMMELTAAERQMAMNEVQVLSVLNHPNIVSYYRSFEHDGILMIEMEYADGGTLAQMLSRLTRPLPEREIISMFSQITAAIRHMHQHNILHRDLKTANVFLTKENAIKVGDFGISKTMTTRAQAQTVLGTPYYISPEMCEGKQYDQKSDIWALGCILYEMACLKRPFQGSSLPALVNSIMKGSFQPIPSSYSVTFRHLITQILQREPYNRPTAGELLEVMIPRTVDLLARQETSSSIGSSTRNAKERSLLYEITGFGSEFGLNPIALPPQIIIEQVAVSNTHFIVLTSVFTWGSGAFGQLGHEDTPSWQSTPTPIAALGDHTIRSVAAGSGFSLFLSDSGMLLTCGDASKGCLGHGDSNNLQKPKLIENLLQVDITMIACGTIHAAALSTDGRMYTWGLGESGRLGLGHERTIYVPTVVEYSHNEKDRLISVHCGEDGTAAITAAGALLACGSNTDNKLGLNSKSFFRGDQIVKKSLRLSRVPCIREPVADISLGVSHTCVISVKDDIITMGRNIEGQLGHTAYGPSNVQSAGEYVIDFISAAPTYTAVTTLENVLLVWGTVYQPKQLSHSQSQKRYTQGLQLKKPTEILALYGSPAQVEAGNIIVMGGVYGSHQGLYITVHTTVPLASTSGSNSSPQDHDTDSIGPVPGWIKADIADSEAAWGGYTSTASSFVT